MLDEDDRLRTELPQADSFLTACWHECGEFLNTGNGLIPLNWQEVDAYCNRSSKTLCAWDCKMLIDMSRAYCTMRQEATDNVGAIAPWLPDDYQLPPVKKLFRG